MTLGKNTIIVMAAVSLLGSAGAAVGTALLLRGKSSGEKHAAVEKPEKKMPATIRPLGEMVINLADPDMEALRYVKISVAVGISEKVSDEELKLYEPALRDVIIQVVSRKTFKQLHNAESLDSLKKELIAGFSERLPTAHVAEVYVEGFAMQ